MTDAPQKQSSIKKALKLILKVGLSLGAIFIIYQKVDVNEAMVYLRKTHWGYLFLGFLAFVGSKAFGAPRINRFYRSQGLVITDVLSTKLYFLGMFYNLFLPLVGGEGYKAFWLKKRYDVKVKTLVWSALLDRASGLVALVMLTVLFFMQSSFDLPYKWLALLLIPLTYLGQFLVMKWFFKSFVSAWLSTSLYSLGVQCCQAITVYLVVLSLGIDANILDYVFVFLLATFAFIIPMVGAREMAFVFGADYLGLNTEISLAIGLLFYLSMALTSLLGASFLLFPKSLEKHVQVAD